MSSASGGGSERIHDGGLHLHRFDDATASDFTAALERILASQTFARAGRPSRLLKFLVERVLAGKADLVSERILALEVFDRKLSFDPGVDPIVRVETGRLRRKLQEYYLSEGREDPVVLELPQRTYVPVLHKKQPAPAVIPTESPKATSLLPRPEPARSFPWSSRSTLLAAAVLIGVAAAGYWARSATKLAAAPAALRSEHGPAPNSIVVLPFTDLSANHDQEYFCDGLTEELTETLTTIRGLRVVAFTTALRWKRRAEDVREIGRQLNVGLVLEGSVRKEGHRVRVAAQLINAADGYHLWSQSYDRTISEGFKLQEEIARGIVSANWRTLTSHVLSSPNHDPARPEAYDLYLQGLYAAQHWSADALKEAVSKFQDSIKADPGYGPAYAALAQYLTLLGVHAGVAPDLAMPKAKAAALKALELDDSLAHAHASLALVKSVYEWDWAGAEKEFRRAMELDPEDSNQRQMYVMGYLVPEGRLDEALTQMQAAKSQDPISTRVESLLGLVYY
jgi:TolB-like protein/Tfp pilus assembly protein PilF